jgi:hypothetical protein
MQEHISITEERYEQLIRAEHDANILKAIIKDAYEEYHAIDRGVLTTLYTMFIGKKEEDNV